MSPSINKSIKKVIRLFGRTEGLQEARLSSRSESSRVVCGEVGLVQGKGDPRKVSE